jgi:hypothetical protein
VPPRLELIFPYHLPTHFIRSLAWLQSIRVKSGLGFNEACCTAGPVSKGWKGIGGERATTRNDEGMEGGTDDCIVPGVLSHWYQARWGGSSLVAEAEALDVNLDFPIRLRASRLESCFRLDGCTREQRLLEGWRDGSGEGSVAGISSRSLNPGFEGNNRLSFSSHLLFGLL